MVPKLGPPSSLFPMLGPPSYIVHAPDVQAWACGGVGVPHQWVKGSLVSLYDLGQSSPHELAFEGGQINSLDFHRKEDLLITASEDDSIRLFDIANGKLLKTTYHKRHGADRICFTHHPHSVICSSIHNLDLHGESLRYLSIYDNRCLRYFKGHKERVVSLCMSPVNDSFMSGSLDHNVRIWDLRVNACQVGITSFME
ncbi:hypothetical protein BC332_10981 [Capsicum chinense]|nr:hypothetical protein BC332_10981 [Capsicum chinense]